MNDILKKISNYLIISVEKDSKVLGLDTGDIGVSIFFLIYYMHSKDVKFLERVQLMLEGLIVKISKPNDYNISNRTLIDFGRYLLFLKKNNLVDTELDHILLMLDQHFERELKKYYETRNFDIIDGALDIGDYFLSRLSSNNNVTHLIEDVIVNLRDISVKDSTGNLFWRSPINNQNNIYLGLHGSAAVLVFLSNAIDSGILVEESKALIVKTVPYILTNKLSDNRNIFPTIVGNQLSNYSLEYAYSDLYVGYGLFRAGFILKNDDFIEESHSVFTNSFKYLDDELISECVRDSGIGYGIEGAYMIYNKMSKISSNLDFVTAKEKCIAYSIKRNALNPQKKHLGYSLNTVFYDPESYYSFTYGLAGVGLAYLSHLNPELDIFDEFLHF